MAKFTKKVEGEVKHVVAAASKHTVAWVIAGVLFAVFVAPFALYFWGKARDEITKASPKVGAHLPQLRPVDAATILKKQA